MTERPKRPRRNSAQYKRTRAEAHFKGYDSKMEVEVAEVFKTLGWQFAHSKKTYNFVGTYEADFDLPHLGDDVVVEVKGFFRTPAEMAKYVHVKKANPHVKIIFIVKNPLAAYRKGVKSSILDWCNKNGFLCLGLTDKTNWVRLIEEWLNVQIRDPS
ncbi:MAG: hypothetical protein H7836_16650 [Magnetococcus sp. YQC-3]